MDMSPLSNTAAALVAAGKGLLAADESSVTAEKRFQSIGVESTDANRRTYRNLLFSTPGIERFLSGVILFDETIRQKADDGMPFAGYLAANGIIPGIKVDKGTKDLALCPGEKVAEGLDGLRERLAEYFKLGARFAKWRTVVTIGAALPTQTCLDANAHALARYAALAMYRVRVEHTILKASMVISGKDCARAAGVGEVAERTVRVLKRTVPAAQPGVDSGIAVASHIFLLARAAEPGAEGVEGPGGQRASGAEGLLSSCPHEWAGLSGKVES